MAAIAHHPKDFLYACHHERARIKTVNSNLSKDNSSFEEEMYASTFKGLKDLAGEHSLFEKGEYLELTRRVWQETKLSTKNWLKAALETHSFAGFYFELALVTCEKASPETKKDVVARDCIPLFKAGRMLADMDALCFEDSSFIEVVDKIEAFYQQLFAHVFFGEEGHSFAEVLAKHDLTKYKDVTDWMLRDAALKKLEETKPQSEWIAFSSNKIDAPLPRQASKKQQTEYAAKTIGSNFTSRRV